MRNSLVWKLSLPFVVLVLTIAGLAAFFFRLTNVDHLHQLLIDQQRSSLQVLLEQYYAENHSWNGIAEGWLRFRPRSYLTLAPTGTAAGNFALGSFTQSETTSEPGTPVPSQPSEDGWRSMFGLADERGVVLVAYSKVYPVGFTMPHYLLRDGAPVMVDGRQVGTILSAPQKPAFQPPESLFLERSNRAMALAMLGVTLVALLSGIMLARALTRPLKELTQAAQDISAGRTAQEIRVVSRDEIGQLAAAFNRMVQDLRENRQALDVRAAELAEGHRQALEAMREAEKANRILQEQMTEIQALQAQLREQAIRDPLTACYNRRYLEETLEREFSRANREGYPVSLALVDIDHFKQINDSYGHPTGDAVLKAISRVLQQLTRSGDVVCRYGGEEFLILLPNLSAENALLRAEEWRQEVERLGYSAQNGPVHATISIGIACYPFDGIYQEQVIARADQALYQAKNGGRNRVEGLKGAAFED